MKVGDSVKYIGTDTYLRSRGIATLVNPTLDGCGWYIRFGNDLNISFAVSGNLVLLPEETKMKFKIGDKVCYVGINHEYVGFKGKVVTIPDNDFHGRYGVCCPENGKIIHLLSEVLDLDITNKESPSPFYMIHVVDGVSPAIRFNTIDAAMKQAESISRSDGKTTYIMASIRQGVVQEAPVLWTAVERKFV